MTDTKPYDFAIVGGTPLALLLAAFLSARHGKRVCLLSPPVSAFRLARGLDLSVAPLTRPERWQLLRKSVPETLRMLSKIGGRKAFHRVDPVWIGQGAATRNALAHALQTATAYGYLVEQTTLRGVPEGTFTLRLRDAVQISRRQLETPPSRWLGKSGVLRLDIKPVIESDGSMRAEGKSGLVEAVQTVLADDVSIIEHVPADQLNAAFQSGSGVSLVTERTGKLAAPLLHFCDRSVTLTQLRGGSVAAHAVGDGGVAHISGALGREGLRIAAQSRYTILSAPDGAPVVDRLGGAWVVAGLGETGAFHAPALARFLAGAATPKEYEFFGAHRLGRPALSPVTEHAFRAAA